MAHSSPAFSFGTSPGHMGKEASTEERSTTLHTKQRINQIPGPGAYETLGPAYSIPSSKFGHSPRISSPDQVYQLPNPPCYPTKNKHSHAMGNESRENTQSGHPVPIHYDPVDYLRSISLPTRSIGGKKRVTFKDSSVNAYKTWGYPPLSHLQPPTASVKWLKAYDSTKYQPNSYSIEERGSMREFKHLKVESWSLINVGVWLESIGMNRYIETFMKYGVNGRALLTLTEDHIQGDLGISVNFHRELILDEISKLRVEEASFVLDFLYGNTHEADEHSQYHKFGLYFILDPGDVKYRRLIEKVVFKLHPSFPQPDVVSYEYPFQCTRVGKGTFQAQILVHWNPQLDIQPTILSHSLSFQTEGKHLHFQHKFEQI